MNDEVGGSTGNRGPIPPPLAAGAAAALPSHPWAERLYGQSLLQEPETATSYLAGALPETAGPYLTTGAMTAAMGLLTIVLFSGTVGIGLNLFLWIAAVNLAGGVVLARVRRHLPKQSIALLLGSTLFAAAFAWRTAAPLLILSFLVSAVFSALALAPSSLSVRLAGTGTAFVAIKQTLVNGMAGFFRLLLEFPWRSLSVSLGPNMRTGLRGFLLALPFLVIFGTLFRMADARFDWLLGTAFSLVFGNLFAHAFWFVVGVYAVSGLLRMAAFGVELEFRGDKWRARLPLGANEGTVCMALLSCLFGGFVLLQLPYLFGGLQHVAELPGLTLAEYARKGFFELATVAALVLPMLLLADWLLNGDATARQRLAFRLVCGFLLVLLAIIMASALQRMNLYMQEYGLTRLRLFVSAFILMLAAVFTWFAATVLRGRREWFFAGALVIGALSSAALIAANPDARIATYNLKRADSGKPTDVSYLLSLSQDAWPVIGRAIEQGRLRNNPQVDELSRRWLRGSAPADWQSWNYSRAQPMDRAGAAH